MSHPSALLLVTLGALALSAASAQAQSAGARLDVGNCAMARGASPVVTKVADMPPALRDQITTLTHGIADAGQAFNLSDTGMRDRPSRRLIQAGRTGRSWYVLYERGGQAAGLQGAVFALSADEAGKATAKPVISLQGLSAEKLCNALDGLLAAGITSAPEW